MFPKTLLITVAPGVEEITGIYEPGPASRKKVWRNSRSYSLSCASADRLQKLSQGVYRYNNSS